MPRGLDPSATHCSTEPPSPRSDGGAKYAGPGGSAFRGEYFGVYSVDQADAVANPLGKLASGNIHHRVGHHARLGFWLDEVRHDLHTSEDYERRFRLLHAGLEGS